MTDLLDQDSVDDFRAAMRDVTDTFHKSPVILRKTDNSEIPLLAGLKPNETGDDGEVNGDRYVREEQTESVERWIVSFNRDYLAEKELVDPDDDTLLIDQEDWIIINGKRFAIVALTDKALFRGVPILVRLTVVR